MTAIVSAVNLYNNSHINVDPSPSPSFSFLQLMNSSLDAILATGSEAIGGYSNGGYGVSGAITTETERRRSSAHSGAVGLTTHEQQPLAESASAAISGTAVQLFPPADSFHHAIAQETQDVTTAPASPSHTSPLAYQPNHPIHVSSPSQNILYSSSSPSPSITMTGTSVMHESASTSNSTTTSTAKRTAPDEYAEGSSSRSSKKNRKSRMVVIAVEDENTGKDVVAAEKQQVPPSSSTVHQKEVEKQSASQPPSTTIKPPVPPRSPSPPHDLHKPAIPSPLCPSTASPCIPSRPPLTRRRSRSSEIALLKFALDPWLRLSRSLDGSKTAIGGGCKQAFNPATYPSTGNLRDLRVSRSCVSSFSDFGGSCGAFELNLPFNFGGATSDITFGFGNGDLAGGVKWNLVDA